MKLARSNAVYIIAFLMWLAAYAYCHAEVCRVAVRLSVDNLHYRVLSPTVDQEHIRRGFEEFALLRERCSTVAVHESAEDCTEFGNGLRKIDHLVPGELAAFDKVTDCKLPPVQGNQSAQPPSLDQLVTQTLSEQQDSDGEASYWIADDLLALLLVYPEEVISNILAHPSFRERFISDLGGRAFEDLDDSPGSTHRVLREKMRVFAGLLARLRRSDKDQAGRMKIISEMERACRCTH